MGVKYGVTSVVKHVELIAIFLVKQINAKDTEVYHRSFALLLVSRRNNPLAGPFGS